MIPLYLYALVTLSGALCGFLLVTRIRRRGRRAGGASLRRTVQTVRRGYRAHAADLWRCDPRDVTGPMEEAAKRDLYAANLGAPLAKRREWIDKDGSLPSLPRNSLLWPGEVTTPTFDVWMEGFVTNGEKELAQLVEAGVQAPTFPDAVVEAIRRNGWDLDYFDRRRLTYWGCRFYDNEEAARGSFG